MPTKRGKAPAPAATTAGDEHEELTLQRLPDVRVTDCFSTLPDVPLLKALSHLAADDLVAAGAASARLGALTGAHRSLWRGKGDVEVESAEGLRVLVRVAPPVDWLQLRVLSYDQFYATFTESCGSDAVTRLTVEGPGVELAASLVRDLAPTLRRLEVSRLDVDMLLDALRAARRLHTLAVTVASGRGAVTANRPQEDVKLPRLRSLELHCDSDLAPSTVTLATLQSLVRGHSAQLRSVSLCSPRLLPLLDACPRDLRRLTVALGPGLAALLRARMQGLRELAVDMLGGPGGGGAGHWDAARHEVEGLLRSWRGPLRRLRLANSRAETLRAVGAGALAGLRHLDVECLVGPVQPLAALAGLPRLRSLVLRDAPPRWWAFHWIPAAAIPALELLVVTSATSCARARCRYEDCPVVLKLVPVLQGLVLRAPKSLHVVLRLACSESSDSDFRCPVFFLHAATDADCPLCAEAVAALRSLDDTNTTEVLRVEVDCANCA